MDDLDGYFRSETNRRLDRIESKIDEVLSFKWKIIGGAGVMGALMSLAVTILVEVVWRWP